MVIFLLLFCRLALRRDNAMTELKREFDLYHHALEERDKMLGIVVDTKYLEASTETIFQYILQLIVVLVVKNSSVGKATQNILIQTSKLPASSHPVAEIRKYLSHPKIYFITNIVLEKHLFKISLI